MFRNLKTANMGRKCFSIKNTLKFKKMQSTKGDFKGAFKFLQGI